MVCGNCGQELKEGVKFCTKCGTKYDVGLLGKSNILSRLSLIFTFVGIIGIIVFGGLSLFVEMNQTFRFSTSSYSAWRVQQAFLDFVRNARFFTIMFRFLILTGIIFAIISLYKQKCKLAFIAGLIPCAYLILSLLGRLILSYPWSYYISNFTF